VARQRDAARIEREVARFRPPRVAIKAIKEGARKPSG
jgi:hypothetical protein